MPTPIRILHIEDDPDDVELLRDAFGDNGFSVEITVVKEGDKVLPLLEKNHDLPQVIVMDLNLPKMHGKEILVKLKSFDRFSSIPVVILTTSSSKEDKLFCTENGANEFITKPYNAEGFRKTVHLILKTVKKNS